MLARVRSRKILIVFVALGLAAGALFLGPSKSQLEQDAVDLAAQVAEREFCERPDAYVGADAVAGQYDFHPQQHDRFQEVYEDHLNTRRTQLAELPGDRRHEFCEAFEENI